MKYSEKTVGSKKESQEYIKDVFGKLVRNQLVVEGQSVDIPDDKELEYKLKYENDEFQGALTLKISWINSEEEEEEEEEEVDQLEL